MSTAVLAFGLVGCGTSSCDSKDIAKQALDILLKNSGMSAEKLGALAVNIVMLDKEKNVCQADIWLQPMRLVSLQAIRLMGHKVKLRIVDDVVTDNVITQDGKEFEGVELGKLTNLVALLGELSDASMKYKVTSGDKGEYILAELVKSSGNEL